MSEPVTQSDLAQVIGPVRGRLDQLSQRVDYVERSHVEHLEDAERDRVVLRQVEMTLARREERDEANSRWIKALSGGTLLGFLSLIALLFDVIQRLNG